MAAQERRQELLGRLSAASSPLAGGRLAKELGVSRQVIVQDVALLRAEGHAITSTARGYVLDARDARRASVAAERPARTQERPARPQEGSPREQTGPARPARRVKVRHTVDQTADELETILANGGEVVDVSVRHRVYGTITAPLGIATREDALRFLDDIATGKSEPLLSVTSGYHYHTIAADSEASLDRIERALDAKGYLAPLLPHERP